MREWHQKNVISAIRGKKAQEEIAGPLALVFVALIATGEVLEEWRVANIAPLSKKSCKVKLETTGWCAGHRWWESYRRRFHACGKVIKLKRVQKI